MDEVFVVFAHEYFILFKSYFLKKEIHMIFMRLFLSLFCLAFIATTVPAHAGKTISVKVRNCLPKMTLHFQTYNQKDKIRLVPYKVEKLAPNKSTTMTCVGKKKCAVMEYVINRSGDKIGFDPVDPYILKGKTVVIYQKKGLFSWSRDKNGKDTCNGYMNRY